MRWVACPSRGAQGCDRLKPTACGVEAEEGAGAPRQIPLANGRADLPVRAHQGGEHIRAIEEICTEEMAGSVMLVMRRSFSIPEAYPIVQTARARSYARAGTDVRARSAEAVEALVGACRLRGEGEF